MGSFCYKNVCASPSVKKFNGLFTQVCGNVFSVWCERGAAYRSGAGKDEYR